MHTWGYEGGMLAYIFLMARSRQQGTGAGTIREILGNGFYGRIKHEQDRINHWATEFPRVPFAPEQNITKVVGTIFTSGTTS